MWRGDRPKSRCLSDTRAFEHHRSCSLQVLLPLWSGRKRKCFFKPCFYDLKCLKHVSESDGDDLPWQCNCPLKGRGWKPRLACAGLQVSPQLWIETEAAWMSLALRGSPLAGPHCEGWHDLPKPSPCQGCTALGTPALVGLCNFYCKFVLAFAELASSLHSFWKKWATYLSTDKHQDDFTQIKEKQTKLHKCWDTPLSEASTFSNPMVRASIGAVLFHLQWGEEEIFTYVSSQLMLAQQTWVTSCHPLYPPITPLPTGQEVPAANRSWQSHLAFSVKLSWRSVG